MNLIKFERHVSVVCTSCVRCLCVITMAQIIGLVAMLVRARRDLLMNFDQTKNQIILTEFTEFIDHLRKCLYIFYC